MGDPNLIFHVKQPTCVTETGILARVLVTLLPVLPLLLPAGAACGCVWNSLACFERRSGRHM